MKRLIIVLISVLLLVAGCGQSLNQSDNTEKDTSQQIQLQTAAKEVDEVETQPPTERTVDTKGEYPWHFFFSDTIAEMQADGETVYLVSDADPLENALLKFANAEEEEGIPKAPAAESWVRYIDTFLSEVGPYMTDEYIAKMIEVKNALLSYEYAIVADLIEEASELR